MAEDYETLFADLRTVWPEEVVQAARLLVAGELTLEEAWEMACVVPVES